eukprot:9263175-Heterocapsa_arctica.AAC.1
MSLFLSIDRSFVIEAALCRAMDGTAGDSIMESHILACFPSDTNLKKLEKTTLELDMIKESTVA